MKIIKKKWCLPWKNHTVKMQCVAYHENRHIILHYIIRCRVVSLCVPVGHNSEPTETPFGLWTSVGPGNYVLDGPWWGPGQYSHGKGQFWGCPKCIRLQQMAQQQGAADLFVRDSIMSWWECSFRMDSAVTGVTSVGLRDRAQCGLGGIVE